MNEKKTFIKNGKYKINKNFLLCNKARNRIYQKVSNVDDAVIDNLNKNHLNFSLIPPKKSLKVPKHPPFLLTGEIFKCTES